MQTPSSEQASSPPLPPGKASAPRAVGSKASTTSSAARDPAEQCCSSPATSPVPLQTTGVESSCPAVLGSGRWRAQLGKSSTELRAWLPLPLPDPHCIFLVSALVCFLVLVILFLLSGSLEMGVSASESHTDRLDSFMQMCP